MVEHVFVYGTLMRGEDNFHLIEPYVVEVTPGEAAGELYHLEYGYPALVLRGGQTVSGEVMRIGDMAEALPVLDHLEGYRRPGDPNNLYERVVGRVSPADGREVKAYVYVWAHTANLATVGVRVESGRWRDFMAEMAAAPDRYYFAYGSCMDTDGYIAASGFAGEFVRVGVARLDGWRFRLNKRAPGDAFAYANIEPAADEAVFGVLYRITRRAEKVFLNGRAGYPYDYFKEYLPVKVGDDVYGSAVVYVAKPACLADGLPISPEYERRLVAGGAGLPRDYQAGFWTEVAGAARRRK